MLPYQRVKRHKFGDKTYQMVWQKPRNCEGVCSPPNQIPNLRRIAINPKLHAKEFMEILLHEGLHAEQWYLEEETVRRIAQNLHNLLWRCGYRLTDGKNNVVEGGTERFEWP